MPPPLPPRSGLPSPLAAPPVPPAAFYAPLPRAGAGRWVPPAFRGGAARSALVASLATDVARRIQPFPTQAAAVAAAAGANAAAAATAAAPVGRRRPAAAAVAAAGGGGGDAPGVGPPSRRRRLGPPPPPVGRDDVVRPGAAARRAAEDVVYDDQETVLFAVEKGADGRRRYVACTRLALWRRYAARLARGLAADTTAAAAPASVAPWGGGGGGGGGGAPARGPPSSVDELPLHVYEVIPSGVRVKLYFDLEFQTGGGLNAAADGRAMVAALLGRVGAALDALRGGRWPPPPPLTPLTPSILPATTTRTATAAASVATDASPPGWPTSTTDVGGKVAVGPLTAPAAEDPVPAAAAPAAPPPSLAPGSDDRALPSVTDVPWYLAGAVYLDSTTSSKFSAHLVLPAVVFPCVADAGVFVKGVVAAAVASDEAANTSLMLVDVAPSSAPPPTAVPTGAPPVETGGASAPPPPEKASAPPRSPLQPPPPSMMAAAAAAAPAPAAARVPFCDTSVYTRNRCFRLVGSSKYGRRARLLPSPLPLPAELSSPLPAAAAGDVGATAAVVQPGISRALFLRSLITAIPTWPPVAVVSTGAVYLGGPPPTSAAVVGSPNPLGGAAAGHLGGGGAPRALGVAGGGAAVLPPYPRLTAHIQALVATGGAPTGGAGTVRTAAFFAASWTAVYSIGGGYRWCTRLGRHHRSNGVYFVVDVPRRSMTLRCYDADCVGWVSPPVALDGALFEGEGPIPAEGEGVGRGGGGEGTRTASPPSPPPLGPRWEPDADERAALEALAAEDLPALWGEEGAAAAGGVCGGNGGRDDGEGGDGPGGAAAAVHAARRGPSCGGWAPDAAEHAALEALAAEDLSALWGEEGAAGAGAGGDNGGTAPPAAPLELRQRRWEPDAAERAAPVAVIAEDVGGLWGDEGAATGSRGAVTPPPPPPRKPPQPPPLLSPSPRSPPPPPSAWRPDAGEQAALAALAAEVGGSEKVV
ncbi:hypothetical protein I4F81_002997 [Pyropia yezoensis]|uniref:Uncharacterized protein n=1 Tax=Pyropia yezoensis TaxID=2788 RepID=A0ACC3BR41_PYRYE|nr:hypothetical protein I4F81_002997 [Neopyropia yezoensis]